jgi:hypothetical protein
MGGRMANDEQLEEFIEFLLGPHFDGTVENAKGQGRGETDGFGGAVNEAWNAGEWGCAMEPLFETVLDSTNGAESIVW